MQTPGPVPHDPTADLVVYSAAFKPFCQSLLAGFTHAHPEVRLQFVDGVSTDLHTHYLGLHQRGEGLPDVIWTWCTWGMPGPTAVPMPMPCPLGRVTKTWRFAPR